MSEAEMFDPEVRALLEEAVRDPHSCLGRVPAEEISTWIGSGTTLSARDHRLTSSEEYLLDVHREQLAELLYWQAFSQLTAGPRRGLDALYFSRGEKLSPYDLARRAGDLPEAPPELVRPQGELLNSMQDEVSASRLAVMAMQVASRPVGRFYIVAALEREGRADLSERLLVKSANYRMPKAVQAAFETLRCKSAFLAGDYEDAVERSLGALSLVGPVGVFVGNLLVNGLLLGHAKAVTKAASMIAACDADGIEEYAEGVVASGLSSYCQPRPGAQKAWGRTVDGLPPVARRIADALH